MKKREESRRGREPSRPEGRERDESERRPKQRGTGYGTERAVYLKYLARKWQGSVPPSAQAYALALRQWRQLPGAVITEPTDLGTIAKPSTPNPGQPPHTPADDSSGGEGQP
jgi:hypothetical protein